eukprot:PITA_24801
MTCNPTSARGHGYIIVVIDYFTKWVEAMPTLNNSAETTTLFFFNHVVARFGVTQAIVTNHGSHFLNHMMAELIAKLALSDDSSTPYYPQVNGQAYRTLMRNATAFTPFQLAYGFEAILSIQCKISSLKIVIDLLPDTSEEEAWFLELIHLDETHHDASLANEVNKKLIKVQYDRNVKPSIFSEGDLVLLYNQEVDKLGAGKFELMWMGPYIVKCVFAKCAYELADYERITFS